MIGIPPVRRRLVGVALRRYREALGYRLEDAAEVLGCDRSKVSRVESGLRGISPGQLRDLLAEYGVAEPEQQTLMRLAGRDGGRGWWQPYTGILPGAWLDYLIMEAAASRIRVYQPQLVPGLLQAPEYTRAVAGAGPELAADARDKMAEAMRARQQVILEQQQPEVDVILGEGALHPLAGDPVVMHAQLARLAELTGSVPQVTVWMLPFTSGIPAAGSGGPFTTLQFAGMPHLGMVHLAGPPGHGGLCLDSLLDVACYGQAFTQLRASALAPPASAQLLADIAAGRRTLVTR